MKDLNYNKAALLFDTIVTGDDVKRRKPHPEGLMKGLKILDIEPTRAVYVGYAVEDLEMAEAANVRFIAVQSEFSRDMPKTIASLWDLPGALRRL